MILIKNGQIVLEDGVLNGDLLIRDGKIAELGESLKAEPGAEIVDAGGAYVFPGFIDPHVHFDMTNAFATTADNYATGSRAALYGGTTTIINFATAEPGMRLDEVIAREKAKADPDCACHYLFHVEMVDVNENTLADIASLSKQGIRSCKMYMAYGFRIDDGEVYQTVKACRDAGMLPEAHCEDGDLLEAIGKELAAEGHFSLPYKPAAHPAEAEANSIAALAYIGKLLDYPVHVVHLSSKLGLQEVRKARRLGVRITVETCPQYLYLDDSVYSRPEEEAIAFVCAPPPRKPEDVEAITEAVIAGEIQTMATDHCAYRIHGQKDRSPGDYRKIPGGIPGVEERAQLCYTKLLASGRMTPQAFAGLMATHSAKLYDIYPKKGVICKGADADLCIYDPEGTTVLSAANLHSAAENSVYEGIEVKGRVRDVFLDGAHVLVNGRLGEVRQGRWLAEACPRNPEAYVKAVEELLK